MAAGLADRVRCPHWRASQLPRESLAPLQAGSAQKLCPSAALADWAGRTTTGDGLLKMLQTPRVHGNSARGEEARGLTKNWSTKLWAKTFQHLLPGTVPSPTWISPQESGFGRMGVSSRRTR